MKLSLHLPRVLVIEDDESFCEALKPWLTKLGYQATFSHSVEDAADQIDPSKIDVILLDLQLPGVDGHFLQRELQRQDVQVPTVVMSGVGSTEDVVESFHLRAADYLEKPFTRERLATALDRARSQAAAAATPPTSAPSPDRASPSEASAVGAPLAPPQAAPPTQAAEKPRTMVMDIRPAVKRLIAQAAQGKLQLPVFDPRASELQQMLTDRDPSMQEVATFIQRDVTLSTEALRNANSAYYARGTQIRKLRDACVRLGTKQIIAIAFQTLMRAQFDGSKGPYAALLQNMWRNAAATSRFAALLARTLKLLTAEEHQVAGLLHNTGEFIFVRSLAELSETTGEEFTIDAVASSVEARHEDFGLAVARAWKLPHDFERIIGYHHRPARAKEGEKERQTRYIILTAWKLALRCGYTYFPGHDELTPTEEQAQLGLSDDNVLPLYQQGLTWSF
jgi:HD-like signal output (HDOD) protein/CheY-like chemotaxis protein